jgi:hypothetical protein
MRKVKKNLTTVIPRNLKSRLNSFLNSSLYLSPELEEGSTNESGNDVLDQTEDELDHYGYACEHLPVS